MIEINVHSQIIVELRLIVIILVSISMKIICDVFI